MGHTGGSESAFFGSALDAPGQNMGFSNGGCCKIGRDERMRIILTWALVVSAHHGKCRRGESWARLLSGSLPNQLPGSYSSNNNSILARRPRAFLSCCNPLPPSVFNNQASLLESVEEISQVRVSPGGAGGGGSCAVLAPLLLHSTTNSTSGFGRFNLSTWGVLGGKR